MSRKVPQLAPAMALAQLLQEHPELPPVHWSVSSHGLLEGYVESDDPMAGLAEYAALFGAEIVPAVRAFEHDGETLRSFEASTRWRDVPVRVKAIVPAAVEAPLAVAA
ncbi:hypothetical protein [Streptomyces sp. SCSIO ZS0520]|uniref:hypothetical protein n=1 Tax=Streptomyces sp. SCSIO ZS0520 TaxID=2892996 RepID=UPI0021D97DCD|nr:hypothetical protein [Streptomyces sp. SCSIO ZS0520]